MSAPAGFRKRLFVEVQLSRNVPTFTEGLGPSKSLAETKPPYTIDVITPLFGGGVEPGVNDPATLIRSSNIRGHLRFWWRATRGVACKTVSELRKRESAIWGSATNPSPVSVKVRVVKAEKPELVKPLVESKTGGMSRTQTN
jgi:CRISPR/Cas system CMR-associated protein Cmr1 (group 7 of RAMP superfamily)